MTTYGDVLESVLVHEHAALLAKAVAEVADPQIRHRGTIGGALVHADPAGDVGAPVLALDAELVIVGAGGERTVRQRVLPRPVRDRRRRGRAAHRVRIPKHTGWGSHYEKFVRVSHQWSIVGVAVTVKADGGTISEARIGLTNMGSTPLRARPWSRPSSAGRPPTSATPAPRWPTAPTRRATSTATPTTGGTWRGCSPVGRSSPPSEADPAWS